MVNTPIDCCLRRPRVGRGRGATRRPMLLGWLLMAGCTRLAALDPATAEEDLRRQENVKTVTEWTERMRLETADDPDRQVDFGVLAERRDRRVTVWAEATGVEAGTAVEFILISMRSGHDYEALAVSMAEPSAVHAALTFIGVPPGQPVDAAGLRFWPRGERVMITAPWTPTPAFPDERPAPEWVAIESFLFDHRQQRPIPVEGFVFTGSAQRNHPQTGEPVYAADVFGPNAIVACYNEPLTVLDVPRQAAQGDVYGSIVPNPERILAAGALLKLILEPEYGPDRRRLFLGRLRMTAADPDAPAPTMDGVRFSVETVDPDDASVTLPAAADLVGLLAWLGRMAEAGRDVFVALQPDERLPWGALRDVYRWVERIENSGGIRIEPPPEGQLYYRAMLPADWFRDRDRRVSHPDELHLPPLPETVGQAEDGGKNAVWTWFDEQWPDERALDPIVHPRETSVRDAAALLALQAEQDYRPQPAVLLVFAPEKLPLGALHRWMLPLRETYPTQYLFAPDPPRPDEAPLEMEAGR